jgi:hypothetical protein
MPFRQACVPFALLLSFAAFSQAQTESGPIKELVEMTKTGKCFNKDEYRTVRGHCAKAFEERFESEIKSAFGEDYAAMTEWFAKRKDIKEEFYTAIDEKNDKVPAALKIFHSLWKKSPEAVAKNSNLAIAISVVWDDRRGIYDYRGHQVRTKSILPSDYLSMTPETCFQDFIDRQRELQAKEGINRLQVLPWEFLIYVVDHMTPLDERKWASKNYVAKRPMVGKIYSDIVYDMEMLRTQNQVCKLNDKPYTLESILKHGGVCAMQADFAARVGKSIIVPAAYVGGESQFQGRHAWVMWVEVRGASTSSVNFTLESHGRYLGDHYYTGELRDPQSGQQILDRDMERRLSAVSQNRIGKRQAELIMEHYDTIVKERELDQKKKILFLDRILSLSPFNEKAWLEMARQVKDGEIDAEAKLVVLNHIESMLKTFAKYPDFTWKVAPDLMLIQNGKLARSQFYERLVTLYEKAERPDLACEARMKWSDFLHEDGKYTLSAKGLAVTIQKFPAEGRYIPKLVDKLKEACDGYKGGNDFMGTQYQELLKKIPTRRGNEVNKYCVQMHEQAINFFKDTKKDKIAKDLEAQLVKIRGK